MPPFVDHIHCHKWIIDLKIIKLLALVASIIAVTYCVEPIEESARILLQSSPYTFFDKTEWQHWHRSGTLTADRPSELTKALQACDADVFPNINPLLTAIYKFWAILPKNLKNHKNYLVRHRPLVFATITLDI